MGKNRFKKARGITLDCPSLGLTLKNACRYSIKSGAISHTNFFTEAKLKMELQINGKAMTADIDPTMPLLWALRDVFNLTGTKYSCGVAACGACTVRVDGQAVRSCVTPVSTVAGKKIQTIESLGTADKPHALQQAWIAEQVPQCGYCQSGMLMAAAALLEKTPKPTDVQIDEAMSNICRCGTYQRVRAAIHRAAGASKGVSDAGPPQGAKAPSGGSAAHAVASVGVTSK
jgi:isoquinoline 1-oxidoreductase subunit alpha